MINFDLEKISLLNFTLVLSCDYFENTIQSLTGRQSSKIFLKNVISWIIWLGSWSKSSFFIKTWKKILKNAFFTKNHYNPTNAHTGPYNKYLIKGRPKIYLLSQFWRLLLHCFQDHQMRNKNLNSSFFCNFLFSPIFHLWK